MFGPFCLLLFVCIFFLRAIRCETMSSLYDVTLRFYLVTSSGDEESELRPDMNFDVVVRVLDIIFSIIFSTRNFSHQIIQ